MSNPASSAADRESAVTTYGPIIVVSGPDGVGKSTTAHLVAAAFKPSVHLDADDLMASVVSGWVDPNLPEAQRQNAAVGGALAVSTMSFATNGYTTVVDGTLVPGGVEGLAAACRDRGLACHYAVLTAKLDFCWERASARGGLRWPLEFEPFAKLHTRSSELDLDDRHVIAATGSPNAVSDAVLDAFRAGQLAVIDQLPQ